MVSTKSIAAIVLIGLSFAWTRPAAAQFLDVPAQVIDTSNESEYTSQTYTPPADYAPNPRMIIHQNAQTRAQQRHLRLSSLAWFGMSNSRPTASPTPFASRYSPTWEMPGGRPFSWYPTTRPTYLIYR